MVYHRLITIILQDQEATKSWIITDLNILTTAKPMLRLDTSAPLSVSGVAPSSSGVDVVDAGAESDDSSNDSGTSGDEVPVWVRGEQRWISGVDKSTTCADLIQVLLEDEATKGRTVGDAQQYHITERWRGVEQPLDDSAAILDIWNAWGNAQSEVKISLRRISSHKTEEHISNRSRRRHHRSTESVSSWGSKHGHTLHPRRLYALAADHRQLPPGGTEELLKLVLAQGEIIRKQLKRLRHSENQIGFIEDKTHRARVRKHGSNYLLETYLKGLPEIAESGQSPSADKHSDSGVMTEGDSGEPTTSTENPYDRLSPESTESKEQEQSTNEDNFNIKEQVETWDMLNKINKKLLKEEEMLVRLHISLRKYERNKDDFDKIQKSLADLRTDMAKSACEMQHNAVVLEETTEKLDSRRSQMHNLQKELGLADQENEMLQTLMYSKEVQAVTPIVHSAKKYNNINHHSTPYYTKELNTLV